MKLSTEFLGAAIGAALTLGTEAQDVHNTNELVAAIAEGSRHIHAVAGTYNIPNLNVWANCTIEGDGEGETVFVPSTPDAITVNAAAVHFKDFTILYPVAMGSGTAILLPGNTLRCSFENLTIGNAYDGISMLRGSESLFSRLHISEYHHWGIVISNLTTPDAGDSTISDCWITTADSGATAIHYSSSGGLRICNCKLNHGLCGVVLEMDNGGDTGDLLISNCSIEGFGMVGILLMNNGSRLFSNIAITGNQIALCRYGVIQLPGPFDTLRPWLSNVSLTGNVISTWIAQTSFPTAANVVIK